MIHEEVSDFSVAKFTAVISDLHLCEEEPVNPEYPLWKKYKTRQFFFDDEFQVFLKRIEEKSQGESIELILNGDIFDFDSVTATPEHPTYFISWLEKKRGMHPKEERSVFKIKRILEHHQEWVVALREFVMRGHRAIFTIGNHDLELHFPRVQEAVHQALDLPKEFADQVRFCEWFYISNGDTLVEHGNQYDPYCMAQDPVNPFVLKDNRLEVRIPFGNLATRYLVNGMGYFNPHLDSNYIMTPKQYIVFFFKYMVKGQPLLVLTWLWSSTLIMIQTFRDRLLPSVKQPITIEDRIEWIAKKSNATPRMVREMKELFVAPAASRPYVIMKELWLDRAFMVVLMFLFLYLAFLQIDRVIDIAFYWMLIPLALFVPFMLFYSRSITSEVREFKEPKEKVMSLTALITKASRVIYGHTHIVRHEVIGAVEHLNSGTWSPAFLDVECEKPLGQKTFIWVEPGETGIREARVLHLSEGRILEVFPAAGGRADRQRQERQAKAEEA